MDYTVDCTYWVFQRRIAEGSGFGMHEHAPNYNYCLALQTLTFVL